MADSHPNTRTGRDATQLTDTASPNLTTALEGEISREHSSPEAKDRARLSHTSARFTHFKTAYVLLISRDVTCQKNLFSSVL